jgi:transposase
VLSLGSNTRIYLATAPADLRKSFDGLSALVEGSFGMDAMSGDLFIFLNRRATQVRILFWDRDGFCVLMKRLE